VPVLSVPRGIQDLTPEWLTDALAGVADGAQAVNLVTIRIGNGSIADSVRLIPSWDRPTPAPPSVVAKVPCSDEAGRLTGFATRTYELESSFYRELASTVWVSRPICYVAQYDLEQERYVVLLEDLAPAAAGDQMEGCTPEDAASVMAELAALHAPRWGDPSLLDLDWLDRPTSDSGQRVAELASTVFAAFVDRYRTRIDPELLDLTERLMASVDRYLTNRPGPWTVVHGDLRPNKLLFGRPRVAVVDWHTVKIGPGLSDVSYFIGSALWPETRRDHEVELVRAYHGQLATAGVEMDWDQCWESYRRYSFDGLLHAMAASMRLPPFERTDDTFMAIVDRHGRHALDLGAEELLQAGTYREP